MTLKIIKNENKEPKFKPVTIQLTFTNREDLSDFLSNWASNQSEELIPCQEYLKLEQLIL